MRNYELIGEIYEICMTADYRDEGHFTAEEVIELIEKERPKVYEKREQTIQQERN